MYKKGDDDSGWNVTNWKVLLLKFERNTDIDVAFDSTVAKQANSLKWERDSLQ